jgi:rSAM/selenodomain-associated transferase 2
MQLSVIIPTFNEEKNISALIQHLLKHADGQLIEILVADGQSTDHTREEAEKAGAKVLICPRRGRAAQMNHAAALSAGDVLYFVHADSLPPPSYPADIQDALDQGFLLGGYRSDYLSDNPLFRINAWFTRFNRSHSHGGDQTLYVDRQLFEKLQGFDEKFVIMEDFDFVKRAQEVTPFRKIPKNALISTRKYDNNSFLRVTVANFIVFSLYRLGVAPPTLKKIYGRLLNQSGPKKESKSVLTQVR